MGKAAPNSSRRRSSAASPIVANAIQMLLPRPIEDVAAVLDGLATAGGDQIFRRAAAALRRKSPYGRRPCDDKRSLAKMGEMLKNGDARTIREAAGHVAAGLSGAHSFNGARDRLAEKYAEMNKAHASDPDAG